VYASIVYRAGKRKGRFNDLLDFSDRLDNNGKVAYARQIHSNKVVSVDTPGLVGECDGLISDCPNVVLAIQVADCLPIFLTAPDMSVIGLIHAGWRGTVAGIAGKAVLKLKKDFGVKPKLLSCFIGPSIHTCCYTVGAEVKEKFHTDHLTKNGPSHYTLDLISANSAQLSEAGVAAEKITVDKRCTHCSESGLHSYRRHGDRAGRNICFLSLK